MPDALDILFERPASINDAVRRLASLDLLPTSMNSAGIQQLSRDVRAASLFSARTTHLGYLAKIEDVAKRMASGEINIATGRALLQDELDAIGYTPAAGFPQPSTLNPQPGEAIPPADPGSLRDLSSDKRLKLELETQTRRAANFAYQRSGMEPDARHEFPAWEFVRIYERDVPRDEMPGGLDWFTRFVMAGGRLVQGRMVALKDDDVWSELGSSTLFQDGMDSDVPPYAFNSGMGWDEVSREECIELGLFTGEEEITDTDTRFFDEDRLNAAQFAPGELTELLEGLRPE